MNDLRPFILYINITSIVVILVSFLSIASANADTRTGQQGRPDYFVSLSGTPVLQTGSDFDEGGSYSVNSWLFRASTAMPVSKKTLLGLSFSYDLADYDFSTPVAFGGASPWDKIHSLTLGLPIITRLDDRWSIFIAPSLAFSREFDASWGDALIYGAITSFSYAFSPRQKLGLGFGAFDRMGQNRVFPFVSVEWYFTDRLRLTNPLRAGPTGPAGLELAYRIDEHWEFGAGTAYRSFRFRLDDQGIAADGIGEQRGTLAFARLKRGFGKKFDLNIYAGAVLNGDLRLDDADNNRLVAAPHATAPLFAISFDGRI